MKTSNFALRLQPALMEEARELAKAEGVALNQLINVAVAEKLAIARTGNFFRRYTRGANVQRALEILDRAGRGNPPMPGDEMPEDLRARFARPQRTASARKTVQKSSGKQAATRRAPARGKAARAHS